MARADFSYTQLCIGDCGHMCDAWPVVSGIGGTNPTVICRECTAAEYGLDHDEATGLAVWVRVKERAPDRPKAAKKAAKPRKKKPSMWDQFLPGNT